MKLYQIEYLIATCTCGSISKAADQLLVSRPAVSRALKELEQEFGVELFMRTTTGISLTEAGQRFYDKCTQIRQLLGELACEMQDLRENAARNADRHLRLGMSFTARYLFFTLLNDFIRQHPDITIDICEIGGKNAASMLRENQLDASISICFSSPEDGLDRINIAESEFVFCCDKSHPLADRERVSIPEIKDEPLVGLESLSFHGNQTEALYAKYNLIPNIQYKTTQLALMKQMVKSGLCGTINPIQSLNDDPDLILIPFDVPVKFPIGMQWNNQIHHNGAFRCFLQYVENYVREQRRQHAPSLERNRSV